MKYLFILWLMSSCSGYKLVDNSNPFKQYQVQSIVIPTFYNKTNLPNVGALFTNEIVNTLSYHRKLRLKFQGDADAHLIGIVESPEQLKETVKGLNKKGVKNTYEDAIGERENFFIYSTNKVKLTLRVILIKHPTSEEVELVKKFSNSEMISSKIIFNERIEVEHSFTLKELEDLGLDVLGTQNKGLQNEAVRTLAQKAAKDFKEIILYAY